MAAATPTPSHPVVRPIEDSHPVVRPIEDPQLAEDAWLAEDPEPPGEWLDEDPWLADDPAPEDPERIAAWLDELERTAPWPYADPDWDDRAPASPPEVIKAGFWDRTTGDGGGFAAGGAADYLPPGHVLAGLAGDRWAAGLGQLTDDELIGVLRAGRRLASWAAAMELAAVADLWRRRTGEEDAGDAGAALHAGDELAAALTLTRRAAEAVLELAVGLARLPATAAALAGGDIDLPRAKVIVEELTGLGDAQAARVERAVVAAAAGLTTGQLRAATHRAVLAADPGAARERKEQALREARVERWSEPAGTAALAGRDLPPAQVLAADANLTALARQLKAAGGEGTLDTLRAQIYLALLTGTPAASLLPARADSPTAPGDRPATPSPATTGTPPATGPANESPAGAGISTSGMYHADVLSPAGPPASTSSAATGPAITSSATTGPASTNTPANGSPAAAGPSATGTPAGAGTPVVSADAFPGLGSLPVGGVVGRINLTLPLATWLGRSDAPGQVAGYGPLDATDSRALADALAAHAGTRWCLTVTGSDGRALAHGCARAGPPPAYRHAERVGTEPPASPHIGFQNKPAPRTGNRPPARPRGAPTDRTGGRPDAASRTQPRSAPTAPTGGRPDAASRTQPRGAPTAPTGGRPDAASRAGPRGGPRAGQRAGPGGRSGASSRDRPGAEVGVRQWTITLTPLDGGRCDHAWETPAYRPSDTLRHLVNTRHTTCVFPGCRRPAAQSDADHTLAYEHGGKTCLCNLAPLCRHHHQVKQTPGWALDHTTPSTLTWTTPSGRRYTTGRSQ